MIVAFLGGARWWWGSRAHKKYQTLIVEARSRGQPIVAQDFDVPDVPDEDNAAMTIAAAANAVRTNAAFDRLYYPWAQPLSDADLTLVRQTIAANTQSLQTARRARSIPHVAWHVPAGSSPLMLTYRPTYLRSVRGLGLLQEWTCLYYHATGNDHETVEELLDLLRESEAIDQEPRTVVNHLVALGISGVACDVIHWSASDPRLHTPSSSRPTDSADLAQVRELINCLLDERALHSAATRAWYGERMLVLDSGNYIAQGGALGYGFVPSPWPLRPLVELAAVRDARRAGEIAFAAGLTDWQSVLAHLPADQPQDRSHFSDLSALFAPSLVPSSERAILQHFKIITERRAAAIELAIRMYRLDHRGEYPQTLEDLVPAYLARLPADPFTLDGHPFRYRRATKPPLIYSVAEDGNDDGGNDYSMGLERWFWKSKDAVFPLEPSTPETQPSTKAQDDQG